MSRDIHNTPFDEETLVKLEIFESYTKEWLPTMIMGNFESDVCIFDFFAGPGYDIVGVPGTPIRILKQIENQYNCIKQKGVTVFVCFNEYYHDKYELLKTNLRNFISASSKLSELKEAGLLKGKILNEDFATIFPKVKRIISKYPSLVILDQNGIKFTSDEYFQFLCKSGVTDFLYYISSSYFLRFGTQPAFKMYIDIDIEKAREQPYKHIHESILSQL